MAKMTPMMEQYFEIKKNYPDCILFYRLGDFYEMFFEDALTASKELEITLTGRDCGQKERAPMCGVPFHSCEPYITKLIEKGYRVAICEQVEDPKAAKGIVKRDVIRIVTPGTNVLTQALDETRNQFIMSIFLQDEGSGIAVCDLTTGEFRLTQVENADSLHDEITRLTPAEIICNDAFCISGAQMDYYKEKMGIVITPLAGNWFDAEECRKHISGQYPDLSMESFSEYPFGVIAAGVMLRYLHETQKTSLSHLSDMIPYKISNYMILDSATRRNLEVCETLRDKHKRGSLLGVLDKTKTAMGARLLRKMTEQPLIRKKEIEQRLDAVEMLQDHAMAREELREYMRAIYDLERLTMKISYQSANPRDLISFKNSLYYLPYIKEILQQFDKGMLHQMARDLDPLEDLYQLIDKAICEDPPVTIREGDIIQEGYDEEADHLKKARTDGKTWLAELETREREKTGIKNLKVKYNKVFGYYLEVTNSYQDLVPDYYIRRQTLANSERYVTEELAELADTITHAQEKLYELEYKLYTDVRDYLASQIDRIQQSARIIAWTDVFCALAYVAEHHNYVRPAINRRGVIDIKGGRHPVVERTIKNELFVDNDTYLDQRKNRISIITGPNMAGKSTYMRQTALIVLMAQIGSFVPARSANIGIVDRIFTRVGASDDLASGQSTFMVEMTEVAHILHNATKNSLLIFDEIGRGTSTYDGLSIAWAVVEFIAGDAMAGAKTLFATHYHELTELEGQLKGVNNYCIAVKEKGDQIIFLRKIVKGSADRSYGIQVARLAGVPDRVIERAGEISAELEAGDLAMRDRKFRNAGEESQEAVQISLFDTIGMVGKEQKESKVEEKIRSLDLSNMTPIQAMNLLYELQKECK